jgi:negative regulator of flagellin synthesis FlgM
MTIDRIGPVDPIQPGRKPERANQASGSPKSDTISISSEALEKAELLRIQKLAVAAPEIRAERVAELKEKINDHSYIDEKMINATADRLISALFT